MKPMDPKYVTLEWKINGGDMKQFIKELSEHKWTDEYVYTIAINAKRILEVN